MVIPTIGLALGAGEPEMNPTRRSSVAIGLALDLWSSFRRYCSYWRLLKDMADSYSTTAPPTDCQAPP